MRALTGLFQTKLKPAKIFKGAVEPTPPSTPVARSHQGPRHITAITFDDRGDQVLTAAEDETFRLYSCKTGKQVLTTLYLLLTTNFCASCSDISKRCTQRNMGLIFLVSRIDIPPSYTLRRRKTTQFGIIHSTTTNTCSISRDTADASSP